MKLTLNGGGQLVETVTVLLARLAVHVIGNSEAS